MTIEEIRVPTARFDHELDVRGQACPLPVINTRKFLGTLASGETLKVLSSDPGAANDFRALAHAVGVELLVQDERNGELLFLIRKP
jgi:tRNA 2-thiouridine synthesizing protein A